jgi:hypothetical protein
VAFSYALIVGSREIGRDMRVGEGVLGLEMFSLDFHESSRSGPERLYP